MKTFDLNKPFLDLDGKPIKQDNIATLGQFLAVQLASSREGDALTFLDWALTLQSNKPLPLDDGAARKLRDFVEKAAMTVLLKGRILQELDNAKEKDKPGG